MDEIKIHIIELQAVQGTLELRLGPLIAGILQPEFGGDEQLAALDATPPNPVADLGFILIGGGGIDQPVTCIDGLDDGTFALCRRHLEDPKAQQGHLDVIVQLYCLHHLLLVLFVIGMT